MAVIINASAKGARAFGRALQAHVKAVQKKNVDSVKHFTRQTQLGIRRDVQAVFRKNRRVANAVRSKVYDNRGRGAAGMIFSKFGRRQGGQFVDFLGPYLSAPFTIRPRRGRYMAVRLGTRGPRSPRDVEKLEPVQIGNRLFLVRSTRTRTTFVFLLLRRVRITRRIRPRRHMRRVARQMPRDLIRRVSAIPARPSGRGGARR